MLVGSLNCHNESREFKMCFLPGLPGGQLYLVRLLRQVWFEESFSWKRDGKSNPAPLGPEQNTP